jgi:hypothetical protein
VQTTFLQNIAAGLEHSVAKGPKFPPQSSNKKKQNLVGPGKSGAELLPALCKKGAELFFRSGFS